MARNTVRARNALERKKKKRQAKRKQSRSGSIQIRSLVARMKTAGRGPLRECLINDGWKTSRLAQVIISRDRPGGSVAVGVFLVDIGCLGVKNTIANDNLTTAEYDDFIGKFAQQQTMIPCDSAFAVKLIQTAVEYAKGAGFRPEKDYAIAQGIFGDIDPNACEEMITCGLDGKPYYVSGPDDDVQRILKRLETHFGPDGFEFIAALDQLDPTW